MTTRYWTDEKNEAIAKLVAIGQSMPTASFSRIWAEAPEDIKATLADKTKGAIASKFYGSGGSAQNPLSKGMRAHWERRRAAGLAKPRRIALAKAGNETPAVVKEQANSRYRLNQCPNCGCPLRALTVAMTTLETP